MKSADALSELDRFSKALDRGTPDMAFSWKQVKPWKGLFKQWFRKEMPGEKASQESGIYLISDQDENILYIGKAAVDNLGAEIWGKFSAATKLDENDIPYFGNSSLAKWASEDKYREIVIQGNVLIQTAVIKPKEFSSLAEVYLHIWCLKSGDWPPLNKRIG